MALGKGLGSLIPPKQNPTTIQNQAAASEYEHARDGVSEVAVSSIVVNPHQPRRHFDAKELEELVQSLQEYGVLQPLLVSRVESGYELIAGERRLRASRLAGLKTVPVIVRTVDELEKVELALIENIQRSDLNPIEKAESYRKLINEFGLNHQEASKKLGISRSGFSNVLRLLDLPGAIQKALAERKISEGHAKVLLGLATEAEQLKMLDTIITGNVSVSAFTALVRGTTKQSRTTTTSSSSLAPHIVDMQQSLASVLSTKVKIKHKGEKGGTIEIKYFSPEELANIAKKINR